ncbi:hypothetical protein [Nannocystis exedens]|uniref:hypothetical protein n=1 Tax=Nannocystis exedens TaxID=54 RepID=UPI000BBA0A4B|nr:hypothetical protein [Nannocystis exedens]
MPALLTRQSSRPHSREVLEHGVDLGRIGEVGGEAQMRDVVDGPQLVQQRLGDVVAVAIVDEDDGARGGESRQAAAPMPRLPPVTRT